MPGNAGRQDRWLTINWNYEQQAQATDGPHITIGGPVAIHGSARQAIRGLQLLVDLPDLMVTRSRNILSISWREKP